MFRTNYSFKLLKRPVGRRTEAGFNVQAANTILTNKLVLASGHPLTNMKEALQRYEKLPFNEQTRENVYYKNAERVLKIKI